MTSPRAGKREPSTTNRRIGALIALTIAFAAIALSFGTRAAPVSITVPYSATPVADGDLDGNPATGAWGDALAATIPLENGEPSPYGSATLYAKHDGTYMYLRVDGSVDVPWAGATGNRFWLGVQISPSGTSHHGTGTWDGVFFGLWDGTNYVPQPVYPPTPVDTNGFGKPPAKDASQDVTGAMRTSGTSAPYGFTAEWKKKLNTGDASDIAYAADGATQYNFYVTTDSDGKGSSGGNIDHSAVTNTNTIKFAPATPPANTPPQVDLTAPDGGEVWPGGSSRTIFWNMSDTESATSALLVWINYSTDGGASYTPIAGAQGVPGFTNPCAYVWTVPSISTTQARISISVSDPQGATASDASTSNFVIDSTPPTIQHTPGTEALVNTPVLIRAAISDVDPIADARVNYTDVLGARTNATMTLSGGVYEYTIPGQPTGGTLSYFIWAIDSNGNAARTPTYSVSIVANDTVSPSITNVQTSPPIQDAGLPVNVSATVSDNVGVQEVRVLVRDPQSSILGNYTMTRVGASNVFFFERAYADLGTYAVTVTATDPSGNLAIAGGSFEIVDRLAPTFDSVALVPAMPETGREVNISAIVRDNLAVAGVRIQLRNGTGVVRAWGMIVAGNEYFAVFVPSEPGNYSFVLTATDSAGNAASAKGNFTVGEAPPPAPMNLLITPVAPACLKVTWEPSQATDVAGYRIYRWNRTRATFDLIANAPADAATYTDCGLEDDTVYSYWVIAYDRYGQPSPPSPIGNGRTAAREPVSTDLDLMYEFVILVLLVSNVVFAALWAGARKRRGPEQGT